MKSIGEHYNTMSEEKDALTQTANLTPSNDSFSSLLASIKNNSRVAVWRLILYVVAVGHWTLDKLFHRHKDEVSGMLQASAKGRESWIIEWVKSYIDGANLEIVDGVPKYPKKTSGDQPVKFASVRDSGEMIFLYVATEDEGGDRTPLDSDVLERFKDFTKRFRIPGTRYNVLSLNPDTLLADIDIYYSGILNEDNVKENVLQAIQNYVSSLPSLGALDGTFYLISLTDYIQEVEGVRDVVYNSITGNNSEITRKYVTEAGYMNFDEGNSNINMIRA